MASSSWPRFNKRSLRRRAGTVLLQSFAKDKATLSSHQDILHKGAILLTGEKPRRSSLQSGICSKTGLLGILVETPESKLIEGVYLPEEADKDLYELICQGLSRLW